MWTCSMQTSKSRFCVYVIIRLVFIWILATNCNWRILFIFDDKSNVLHVGFIKHLLNTVYKRRILSTNEE